MYGFLGRPGIETSPEKMQLLRECIGLTYFYGSVKWKTASRTTTGIRA